MNRSSRMSSRCFSLMILSLALIAVAGRGCAAKRPVAQAPPPQRGFASPEVALESLVAAMRAHDTAQLQAIFGPDSDDLLFSGDPVDDDLTLDRFVSAYDEKHRLVANGERGMTVVVGGDDWPMPIPIVKDDSGKGWVFDTATGRDEVITRRIGRNELTVIEVCKAICDAQREYARRDPDADAIPEYARKLISDAGKTNGLYWPTAAGDEPSPLGEAVAEAQGEGYSATQPSSGGPRPYHGYLYRILTAQGKDAPGGAEDYIVNGKFIGGFAVVAWPVEYGSSGIMTFIAGYTGDVYQKDLGEETDGRARAMVEFNPDPTWTRAEQGDAP